MKPVDVPVEWIKKAKKAIRAFPFWDYGMDEVDPKSKYAEWVPSLARDVIAAVHNPIAQQERAKVAAEIRVRASVYRDAEVSQETLGAQWDATRTAMLWDSVADFLERGEGR